MKRKKMLFDQECWNGGFMEYCRADEKGLQAEDMAGSFLKKSVYLSFPVDSGEKETVWGRMRMKFRLEGDCSIVVSWFAADEFKEKNGNFDLSEYFQDPHIPFVEKESIFDKLKADERKNQEDILLTKAKGRYLWFKIEMVYFDAPPPVVEWLMLEYPFEPIAAYLPRFYMEDRDGFAFLGRYLGIYQSLIYDLQDNIDGISRQFDPAFAEGKFLRWLAGWVSIDVPASWSDEKLRKFMEISFSLYRQKGTIPCLKRLIEFCTGEIPVIIENYAIAENFEKGRFNENYKLLYGDDPYSFFIFLSEEAAGGEEEQKELQMLVERYKPAHTTARFVLLKQCVILDRHTYLGVNTVLKGNSDIQLGDDGEETIFRRAILS